MVPHPSNYLSMLRRQFSYNICVYITAATCPGVVTKVTEDTSIVTNKDSNGAWARDPFQQTQK